MNLRAHYRLLPVLLLCCLALPAQAVSYAASLNQAEWRLQSSLFECRLWQPIPHYGDAVFSNKAGLPQEFYLAPVRTKMKPGKARLVSRAPVWDEGREPVDMGLVTVRSSATPVRLGSRQSYQLLNQLYKGMSPVFTRANRYEVGNKVVGDKGYEPLELMLSSVSFRQAYGEYRQCLTSLLPVNFEQIERSRFYFQTAAELTATTKAALDKVVRYVKADPSVTGFFVDGHTDSVGRRLYNLELSKKRAEAVTRYLVARGVDESLITTRYHGERYPIANNSSAKNRAANRRVTLRLERDGL